MSQKYLKSPCSNKYQIFLTNLFLCIINVVFAKVLGAQHCLVAMLEKWKSCNDKGKSFGALMTDLSKALDFLSHELGKWALWLLNSHLSERK